MREAFAGARGLPDMIDDDDDDDDDFSSFGVPATSLQGLSQSAGASLDDDEDDDFRCSLCLTHGDI